jgi:hypothetical protein
MYEVDQPWIDPNRSNPIPGSSTLGSIRDRSGRDHRQACSIVLACSALRRQAVCLRRSQTHKRRTKI